MSDFSLGTVEVSLTPLQRFEEFLQSRGKRITQQRRIIVEQVSSRHEHFDADQLLADLQKTPEHRKVSRPTVYRTLAELTDAGLLRAMSLNGRAVYEHDYGYPQHDHLQCTECDKLIEFQSEEVNAIREAVAREHQFRVTGHRLIISGLCLECRNAKQRSMRRLDVL
ncbi:MAG: transcriptional repressor [Planctomycetota bacterium]|nr:transcriptional repressor [Planctomycetota bacterium]